MGWSIGTGENGRDIGYGVPAICDAPKCRKEIDRGVSFCCGFSSDDGCGLYFCEDHLICADFNDEFSDSLCHPCAIAWKLNQMDPNEGWKLAPVGYKPKKDCLKWVIWKIYHDSWQQWRDENVEEYGKLKKRELHAAATSRKIFKKFQGEEGFPNHDQMLI